jgi:hypothetical protein
MARFVVRGINDDKSFCECCGKSGLQRVVWIEDLETGEVKHFGTVCALKPAKGFDCVAEIKSAIKAAKDEEKAICSTAGYRYRTVHGGTYINGRDKDGSPIRTVADKALWNQCLKEATKMRRAA